jgi:hypothetical protein
MGAARMRLTLTVTTGPHKGRKFTFAAKQKGTS